LHGTASNVLHHVVASFHVALQVSSHHFSVSLHPAGCPLATPSSKHTAHVDPSSAKQASNRALPDELLQLADASAPILLPTSSSVPAGSLDNRQLDKLVGTLGRNKATWRRAVVLLQWLQDIGHVLDDRLCTTVRDTACKQAAYALSSRCLMYIGCLYCSLIDTFCI
jgi:hypothetical protein